MRTCTSAIAIVLATTFPTAVMAGTEENMSAVTIALSKQRIKWEPQGDQVCFHDKFCAVMAGPIQINATGFIVDVLVSSMASTEQYFKVCSAALSGLATISKGNSQTYIRQAFEEASVAGAAKFEINTTTIRVKPSLDSRLECSFVKK